MIPKEILEKFGITELKMGQGPAIESILSGNDTMVIYPTGHGKSVCFQIPAVMFPGLTIVFSPLISLMKSQVDSMRKIGVHAAFWNSSMRQFEEDEVIQNLYKGQTKLLYIAPEKLTSERIYQVLEGMKISMVVVDEAHCVWSWGIDFRPAYRKISVFIRRIKQKSDPVVVLATATASEEVVATMEREYEFTHYSKFAINPDRPNLSYHTWESHGMPFVELAKRLYTNFDPDRQALFFCGTHDRCEKIAATLRAMKYSACFYHAGMKPYERKEVQDDFLAGKYRICCATNAFGMGIDIPKISIVLHLFVPTSFDMYLQEAGRGGRDGKPCECWIHKTSNMWLQNKFLENKNPSLYEIQQVFEYLKGILPIGMRIEKTELEIAEGAEVDSEKVQSIKNVLKAYNHIKAWRNKGTHFMVRIIKQIEANKKAKASIMKLITEKGMQDEDGDYHWELKKLEEESGVGIDLLRRHLAELARAGYIEYQAPYRGSIIILLTSEFAITQEMIYEKFERDYKNFQMLLDFLAIPDDKKKDFIFKYYDWNPAEKYKVGSKAPTQAEYEKYLDSLPLPF